MTLNLKVSARDAFQAFGDVNAKRLIKEVSSGFDTLTGLPLTRPSVSILPPESEPSATRTITLDLNMQIAESDEDSYEKFEAVVKSLIAGSQGIAAQAFGAQAGVPVDPEDVLSTVLGTMRSIDQILEKERVTRVLSVDDLKIVLEGRKNRPVMLTARVFVEASWVTDDPADDGNKAWFELESFRISTLADVRASPNRWDASTWDPTAAVPSNHDGRSFMETHGPSDRVGAFQTQPGDQPRPSLAKVIGGPITTDQTSVSCIISANVEADDTVIVVVQRLRLVLEAAVVQEFVLDIPVGPLTDFAPIGQPVADVQPGFVLAGEPAFNLRPAPGGISPPTPRPLGA
jgi:hypothetical protein